MNKELLTRIEKLEQAIRDIRAFCSCLSIPKSEEDYITFCPDVPDIEEEELPSEEIEDHD